MDAFFLDPQVPRLPPEETRILDLRAEPYPDGRRVRVSLELTPFQNRPYLEFTLTDPSGNPCASASIIEPMGWTLELTLHIAHGTSHVARGRYTLTATLSYPDLSEIDRRETAIVIPPATQ